MSLSALVDCSVEDMNVYLSFEGKKLLMEALQPLYNQLAPIYEYKNLETYLHHIPGELGRHAYTEAIIAQTREQPAGCAIVRYLCDEILDVSKTLIDERGIITQDKIREGIRKDPELHKMFSNV